MKALYVTRQTVAGYETAFYPWKRRVFTTEIWLTLFGMPIYRLHYYRIPTNTLTLNPSQL